MRWAELILAGILVITLLCSSVKVIEVAQLKELDDQYAYLFKNPVKRNPQGHLPGAYRRLLEESSDVEK